MATQRRPCSRRRRCVSLARSAALLGIVGIGRGVVADDNGQNTIAEIVIGDDDYTTFRNMLDRTDLTNILDGPSASFTVFAPTDNAFFSLPRTVVDLMYNDDYIPHVRDIMLKHILPVELPSSDVSNGLTRQTLNSESLVFTVGSNSRITVEPGDATIVTPDIAASNGFVYVVDKILPPSWVRKLIFDVILDNARFGAIAKLVRRVGDVVSALDSVEPHTFFAPSNAALNAVEQADPQAYAALPYYDSILGFVLNAHIVPGVFSAEHIPQGESKLMTLAGIELSVLHINNKIFVNGIQVVDTNAFAENGVIHTIDGLVVPDGLDLSTLGSPKHVEYIARDPAPTELPLGLCEGDCDSDDDCTDGLVCVERGRGEDIIGCVGSLQNNVDYCVIPPANYNAPTSSPRRPDPPVAEFPLSLCKYDCAPDEDCTGDLFISQRGRENKIWVVACS